MMQPRRPRPPRRRELGAKRRFKVFLVRRLNGREVRTKVVTQALSRDQAARFAAIRKPGFSIVRVEED